MKLDLTAEAVTPEIEAILASGGVPVTKFKIYSPLMQLLVAPADKEDDAVVLWELSQKFYANKDGEIELTDREVGILREKAKLIAYPWLRVRLAQLLK